MARIESAKLSHPGRKRPNNEDFTALFEPVDSHEQERNGCLYVVTDGVGGAAKGERASRYAAEKLIFEYFSRSNLEPAERLTQIIKEINTEIHDFAEESGRPARMATTLVAALVRGNKLTVANVGDSRAYLLRGGDAKQITRDHSIVGELVRDGAMTEAEAQSSKVKNRLTRSVGGDPDVSVDIYPDIPLQPGDRILLCTDGLTRYALREDIASMAREGTLEEIANRLTDFANGRGGADNISVVLVSFETGAAEAPTVRVRLSAPKPIGFDSRDTQPDFVRGRRVSPVRKTQKAALIPRRYIPHVTVVIILLFIATVVVGGIFLKDWLSLPAIPTIMSPPVQPVIETSPPPETSIPATVPPANIPSNPLAPMSSQAGLGYLCVVEANTSQGKYMIGYLKDFGINYDFDGRITYYRCVVQLEPDYRCTEKIILERNSDKYHSPIIHDGDWLVIPDVNNDACITGGGKWIPGP